MRLSGNNHGGAEPLTVHMFIYIYGFFSQWTLKMKIGDCEDHLMFKLKGPLHFHMTNNYCILYETIKQCVAL